MNGTGRLAAPALPALLALGASAAPALAKTPKGYTVVTSEAVTGYAGWFTRGEVSCPRGKVPLAGGVVFDSFDLGMNVIDSLPSERGWVVDVRNGLSDVTFATYAVCAHKPRQYQVVTSAWNDY